MYAASMVKMILLALLAAACATPVAPHIFRLDSIESGPRRAANDPARIDARRDVDRRMTEGIATHWEVFANMIADGCPEGWIGLFRLVPVQGRERAAAQCQILGRLADLDPDHEWFAGHIARTWIDTEAAIDIREGFASQLRSRSNFVEQPLTRLATQASRADVRAAAAGALGRMLVFGNLPTKNGAEPVARGAAHLRSALSVWSSGIETPVALALHQPRTSESARSELQELTVAAVARVQGQRLASISVFDPYGQRIGIADALGQRPAVVVVWGFA